MRPIIQESWRAISSTYPSPTATWNLLNKSYGDPARGYHGWNHIASLLGGLRRTQDLAVRPDLIRHAIFWHDQVYSTQAPDGSYRPDALNVSESAENFRVQADWRPSDMKAVTGMINATNGHKLPAIETYPGFRKDVGLFLDLDLSPLAQAWPAFAANTRAIYKEFAWIPLPQFCQSRVEILSKFAERKPTYFTPDLETRWGARARANLRRSCEILARNELP